MMPPEAPRTMRIALALHLPASPERVFAALTAEIDAWWTFRFHQPSTVRLDAHAGGRLVESWDGGEIELATVTRAQPGVLIVLAGSMGLGEAVTGEVAVTLIGAAGGTQLALTHVASGELPAEAEERYREGWRALLGEHLRTYLAR